MSKEKTLMITIPPEQVEDTLKDALDKSNVERGLIISSDIGKNIYKNFNRLKEFGYFPVGLIIEDGMNLEILFQRHPKQSKEQKLHEFKNLKYKL
tara:strand:- start:832 stop:1116 length:285 start_codon:yes stop_codon:yes gene_type:complete